MINLQNPIHIIIGGYFEGDSKWHNHHQMVDNCFKIYYVTRGELWVEDDEQIYHLTSGNLYIINGHRLKSFGANSFSVYWFHFVPHESRLYYSLNTLPTVSQVSSSIIDMINEYEIFSGQEALLFGDNSNPLYSIKFQHVVLSIIIDTLQESQLPFSDSCSELHKIEPAIKLIDEHYDENINLDELALSCHLSPSHFHKLFSATMKTTPKNYIMGKKMSMALTLINMGDNIKQVAYGLGFCDDAHFSKIFKNHFGFTPGYYKKRAGITL